MSEGKDLELSGQGVEVEFDPDEPQELPDTTVEQQLYSEAKRAKVGQKMHCPTCKRFLKKKSYQHVFCTNKGPNNCKDRYWNIVDETRFYRAIIMSE